MFLSAHELFHFLFVSLGKGFIIVVFIYTFLRALKQKFLIRVVFLTWQSLVWKKRHKHYNCFVYLQLIDLVMLKNKKRRLKKLLFNLCNSGNFSLLFLFNMKLILKCKTTYLVVKMVSEYTYPHLL